MDKGSPSDERPDLGLFRLVARCASIVEPWHAYLSALHTSLELDPRLRELAILQVAHDESCDYERVQHEAIARRLGVDEGTIRSLADGAPRGALPPPTVAALCVAREVLRDGAASPTAIGDLIARVGERQAVELVLVVGQYIALARLLKTFAVPVDAPVVSTAPDERACCPSTVRRDRPTAAGDAIELVALIKHDCPVCDLVLPALEHARALGDPVRIVSQSPSAETAAQAARLRLSSLPDLDQDLELSARLDPDAVPAVVLLDGGEERDRVEGLDRARLAALAARAGVTLELDGLPERRPGCASVTRDGRVAARLAARAARASGRLRAREVGIGDLEDVMEALHDRGFSDGLPLVPPTPERVVEMLDATTRDAQDLVGMVPPYDGQATVEKVAINAVMAGCPPAVLPIVLAAVEAVCDPAFALLGVVATTFPAGPVVVVSGPMAGRVGMNSAGNALGQGNRANMTIGRAVQLVVRNVGGARPQHEDCATHGQNGKLSACFAERLHDSPWPGLAQDRGVPESETGVTLFAAEAPRAVTDQVARTPEQLCETLRTALGASGLESALVVVGPDLGQLFRGAGWDRTRVRAALGAEPGDADRILLAHAGGDAGRFIMVHRGWVSGETGSQPVTRSVASWT